MNRLQWQSVCLAAAPDRFRMMGLSCDWPLRTVHVRVHRNHAFEFMQSPAQTFMAYGGLSPRWTLSDYDDSFSFSHVDPAGNGASVDVELVWIDFGQYSLDGAGLRDWLEERLESLRRLSNAPILLTGPLSTDAADAGTVAEAAAMVPGVHFLDLAPVEREIADRFLDLARAGFQGTRFSRQAQLALAQWLGLKWLPAAVAPRLKALAIDLDNTLYRGVLGEDGPTGVELTPGHRLLQEALVRLGEEGVLLAVVSKNEMADVERLFAMRQDFPLRHGHLAGIRANWEPKAENISALAREFNIAPTAFALLDDNPGELFTVADAIPGLSILHASDDAALTAEHLARFPGLTAFAVDETDVLRSADIRAASERAAVAAPHDPAAYLAALETRLLFQVRPRERFKRLCELPQKTNQFNLALRRLRDGDVARFLEAPDHCVVAFDLKDKLSDSGNVGAAYVRADGDVLVVEELCVSCRALGRSIEDLMIGEAIGLAAGAIGGTFEAVEFVYRKGPRNAPALAWLGRLAPDAAKIEGEGSEDAPLRALRVPFAALKKLGALRTMLPDSLISVIK